MKYNHYKILSNFLILKSLLTQCFAYIFKKGDKSIKMHCMLVRSLKSVCVAYSSPMHVQDPKLGAHPELHVGVPQQRGGFGKRTTATRHGVPMISYTTEYWTCENKVFERHQGDHPGTSKDTVVCLPNMALGNDLKKTSRVTTDDWWVVSQGKSKKWW